ncbi:uncharacterized protein LOC144618165 [Crassostrea virginica]
MILNAAKRLILLVIFTFLLGIDVYSIIKPEIADDGSVKCYSNHYFNGNVCLECTAGLYGDNCLALCPYPSFGVLCNETCDCSKPACHHAYGCKTTTLISAEIPVYVTVDERQRMQTTTKVCPVGFFGENCSASCIFPQYGTLCNETCDCSNASCHHVYGCETTIVTTSAMRAKEEETVKKKNYIKITIVVIGISLSAVLLLLIAREIYQLLHIHEICGNPQLSGGSLDEDNVYNEITRTLQETSWT